MGPEQTETLATPPGFRRFTDQRYAKAWIVYAKQSLAGPGYGLDSLSRSPHRVAIAHHRIVDVQDGQGHVPSRTRRQDNRVPTMTLDAHACIRRLLLHVVPRGLQRMRPIGFLANRCQARALRQGHALLDQPATPPPAEQKTVLQWIWQLTGTDIARCPQCGQGPRQRTPLPALPLRPGPLAKPPIVDSS